MKVLWPFVLFLVFVMVVLSLPACTAAWPQCSQTVKVPLKQQYVQPEQVIVNSYCIDYVGDQEKS